MAKAAKKAAPKKDQPKVPRSKKPDADKGARQLKDLNTALAPLAEEGRRKKAAEARATPEYGMDKLARTPRATVEAVADGIAAEARDAFKPSVERGPNVDIVNGRWKTTTADTLRTLAKRYQSAKDTAKSASSNAGELLKQAEESKNLDIWAFREAYKFSKVSDELLCRRLPVFLKYLDDLGVMDRATAQADLLDAANASAAEKREEEQSDIEGQIAQQNAAEAEAKGDEAKAAAAGLSPSRRPTMTIVPKPPAEDAKPPSETESPPTAPSTATG